MPFPLVAGLGLALIASAAAAEPHRYRIDPEHFSIAFSSNHLGYADVMGLFTAAEGSFVYDAEARTLSDLTVTIRTASVFTGHAKRDGHVGSKDFLNVEEYPEMTFVLTSAEPTGETTGTLTGDLKLLGVTKPVTLDVTLNKSDVYPFGHEKPTLGLSAETTVRRGDFGMTYFLPLVADEVPVRFEMEAIRQD